MTENLVIRTSGRFNGAKEWIEVALLSTEIPFDSSPEPVLRAVVRLVAMGPDARDDDVALVSRMVRACPRRVRGLSGGTLSRMNVYDGLANLDVPATVIAGTADRMTPPVDSHKLAAELPRAPEVIEVPRVGPHGAARGRRGRLLPSLAAYSKARSRAWRRRRRPKAAAG